MLARDWIELKIDQDEMKHAKELVAELRGERRGGIPWTTVLGVSGEGAQELVTSDRPEGGNIGCPIMPEEQAWFVEMLRRTRTSLTDEELAQLGAALEAWAAPTLERLRQPRDG